MLKQKNNKISWYQYADITEADMNRPIMLVLYFEHSGKFPIYKIGFLCIRLSYTLVYILAGLNLPAESYNLILYTPLYLGEGGTTDDPVADVSVELKSIGRVHRPGQAKYLVNVYRIHVKGPHGEECINGLQIRRNIDKETKEMATNSNE